MGEPDVPTRVVAVVIEAYVTTAAQAAAAERAGAGRIELCGPGHDGLTASSALIRETLGAVRIPVHAMVRPREGGFVYTPAEVAQMREEIVAAKTAGAHGVVFGVLTPEGTFDVPVMRELIALARPMRVAVHRAFDHSRDPDESLQVLLALGVDVILAAGHAPTALEGVETLRRLQARAGDRCVILAGGSVRGHNAAEIVARAGLREVHARAMDPDIIAGIAAALGAA